MNSVDSRTEERILLSARGISIVDATTTHAAGLYRPLNGFLARHRSRYEWAICYDSARALAGAFPHACRDLLCPRDQRLSVAPIGITIDREKAILVVNFPFRFLLQFL